MIERLAELNRVLAVMRDLMDEKGEAFERSVIRSCGARVIEGRMPDHEKTLDFAVELGLLERRRRKSANAIILRSEGREFLELNPEELYELSPDQRRLLMRVSYLHGSLSAKTREVLGSFEPSYEGSTYRWSPVDSPRLEGERWVLDHLKELGVIVREKDGLTVSGEYVETVSSFLAEDKSVTQEQLEQFIRERQEIGALAEELMLQYERERLRSAGADVEALCVRNIGRLRTGAGYDIESFDGSKANLDYERFIEVKGSRGRDVAFVWSENEMRVARKLRSQYWIYFIGGVDISISSAKYKPVLFQDPIKSVLKHAKLKVMQHGVIVQGGVRGERVLS